MHSCAGPLEWAAFAAAVLAVMALDRLVFGAGKPDEHAMPIREAALRSLLVVLSAFLFCGFVYVRLGQDKAASYLVAYLVEESLSVDNLFVFLVIFKYFAVNDARQKRILFWGVAGAIVMRGVFIFAGAALLHRFHFLNYVFGAFLLYTGGKLLFHREDDTVNPEDNIALKLGRRYLRTTNEYDGDRFTLVKNGVRFVTPLFLVLLVIEVSDLLFAVDSVPAVLAVSPDVFVVYTSNIMAILGLRALYFLISHMMTRFAYLGIGLSIVLIFIGAKMILGQHVHIPSLLSLAVIAVVLALTVLISLLRPPKGDTSE
ncbi:MAG TPA: TerC/Alx family metal homeostasis membrane protein [Polyangiaceae bacterium]|jgi:tellurite resistance protein TerC